MECMTLEILSKILRKGWQRKKLQEQLLALVSLEASLRGNPENGEGF